MYARPSHGTARSRPAPPARSADNSPSLSHQERAEPAEPGDRRPTAVPLLGGMRERGGPRLFADEDGEARGRRAAPESEPPATLLRRRDDRREDGLASATGIRRAIKHLLERSRTEAKALPTQQQRLPDQSAATNEPGIFCVRPLAASRYFPTRSRKRPPRTSYSRTISPRNGPARTTSPSTRVAAQTGEAPWLVDAELDAGASGTPDRGSVCSPHATSELPTTATRGTATAMLQRDRRFP